MKNTSFNKISVFLLLSLSLFSCARTPPGGAALDWRSNDAWAFNGNEISINGKVDSFLVSHLRYENFRLMLSFWVDDTTNSGIFINCPEATNINPQDCYEINIWDEHPRQEMRTGAIVLKQMPPLTQVNTVHKWNVYMIEKKQKVLTVILNDKMTAQLPVENSKPGFIALQHAGEGTVKFKNIRIEEL